jgi:hypothetical protein
MSLWGHLKCSNEPLSADGSIIVVVAAAGLTQDDSCSAVNSRKWLRCIPFREIIHDPCVFENFYVILQHRRNIFEIQTTNRNLNRQLKYQFNSFSLYFVFQLVFRVSPCILYFNLDLVEILRKFTYKLYFIWWFVFQLPFRVSVCIMCFKFETRNTS